MSYEHRQALRETLMTAINLLWSYKKQYIENLDHESDPRDADLCALTALF